MEPTDMPEVDKAALARMLVERAKADLEAKKAAVGPSTADKAQLAKELVVKAKADQAAKKASDAAARKDKAELARKLVEKVKSSQAAEPRTAAPPKPETKQATAARPRVEEESLASRAGAPQAKQISAKDALAAAIAAEAAAEAAPTPAPKAEAATPEPAVESPAEPVPEVVTHPAAVAALSMLPGGNAIREPIAITRIPVFTALWKAHRSRAQKSGDAAFVATASVLLDAVGARPLTAVEVQLGEVHWAVFVDDAGKLLGAVQPAETYLAGL